MTLLPFAFVGGLLLNLMPCCLPVLALKAVSIDEDQHWFVIGMLSVFAVLGALAGLAGYGWGDQFNSNVFRYMMAVVVGVSGLAYIDRFEFPSFGFRTKNPGTFAKGVLAVLLGTACSGPLLGPVFAATLVQPPLVTFSIFLMIGLGMAFPFLLLAAIPHAKTLIPKPGAWMVRFKQAMGWCMICVATWLLLPRTLDTSWEQYSGALPMNQIVLVKFESEFCLTCLINDHVLKSEEVKAAIEQYGVKPLIADVGNEDADQLLTSLGYTTVPMLAIYPAGGEPILLPDLISAEAVIEAVKAAAQP